MIPLILIGAAYLIGKTMEGDGYVKECKSAKYDTGGDIQEVKNILETKSPQDGNNTNSSEEGKTTKQKFKEKAKEYYINSNPAFAAVYKVAKEKGLTRFALA